jgi:hypothetical protein
VRICLIIALAVMTAGAMAQADSGAATNRVEAEASSQPTPAQRARAYEQATEKIRAECIQGRRIICGKILQITADGLVVQSGYTNLMRAPLSKKWLIPATVQAERALDLIESNEAGSPCVGLVFLTALPKSRLAKPQLYDFVVIQAYPAGQYSYTSVGTIRRTVRRFSSSLAAAIRMNRAAAGLEPPVAASENK